MLPKEDKKQKEKRTWHIPKLHFVLRILIYMMTVVSGILSVVALISDTLPSFYVYAIYTVAGCMLTFTCIYIVPIILLLHL